LLQFKGITEITTPNFLAALGKFSIGHVSGLVAATIALRPDWPGSRRS
jgi:hypothetical protein